MPGDGCPQDRTKGRALSPAGPWSQRTWSHVQPPAEERERPRHRPCSECEVLPFYSKTSFSCSRDKGRKACTSDRRASLCPKALDHTWWPRLTTWSPCRWPRDHHPLCPVRLAKSLPCPGWPVPLGTSPGEAKMPWVPPPCFFTMFARGWCHRGLPRGFGKAGPSRRATWPTQFPENCRGYTGPADSSCYMGAGKLRGHHQGVTTVSPILLVEAGQPRSPRDSSASAD